MNKIIVIGGGASGLVAAITAAKNGASVTLLEAMEKPGKKILITGNGKCNLTNVDFKRSDIYRSECSEMPQKSLKLFGHEDTIAFFREIGLLTHERNGGIYPLTDQASSVTDLLVAEARRYKVKIKCTEKAEKIYKEKEIWKVKTNSWTYEADKVILACGSRSYPMTGSDGSGYELCKKLGLTVIEPLPALVPLIVSDSYAGKLAGIRSNAVVKLVISDQNEILTCKEERGEVQWTEYGVSGIVIFQLSRYAVKACREKKKVSLLIDVLPDLTEEELFSFLIKRKDAGTLADLLSGILPKKMIPVIVKLAELTVDKKGSSLTDREWNALVKQMKKIRLEVKGSKSFDMSQVCQGGVALSQIDPETMEVKKKRGLYITGELLDVDGICGGYNLQWAWTSGYLAGKASAQ